MSYKSNWVVILANFKTKITLYLAKPSCVTAQALEDCQTNFIAFVYGHSALLRNNIYDEEVIKAFNKLIEIQNSPTTNDSQTLNSCQKLIDSIDTAIANNKEEKMTTNYNISGNAQIGDSNSQTNTHNTTDININLQTLINKIEESGDSEAKSKLLDFLDNGTIASIIGVTAAEITKLFG